MNRYFPLHPTGYWLTFLFWLLMTTAVFANSLQVMEVTERTFDNSPALAIVFSEPLDPIQRYDAFLTVNTEQQSQVEGAWVVGDNPHILFFPDVLPETKYTVTILAGLPAASGNKLLDLVSKTMSSQPLAPAFGFASQGLILPAELTSGLPIITVNVDAVDLEFFRVPLDQMTNFLDGISRSSSKSYWELDELNEFAQSVYLGRFNTNAKPNKRTVSHLPVEDITELKAPGLYVAVMKQPGQFDNNYQMAYFFVSDIGLHARRYGQRFEVYAASLRTGQPLPKVELTLYTQATERVKHGILAKAFTDAQGRTYFETLPETVKLLTAQLNNHLSFLFLDDPALDLSEFNISGLRAQAVEIFMYGPRNIYRPGETVYVSALLRNEDGRTLIAPPLHAKLKRPDGREIQTWVWQSQTLGYYAKTFDLPKDAQTGQWWLEAYTDPNDSTPTQVYHFQVEEFLPERMKLTLSSPSDYLKPQQELEVQVAGLYLYGAPAVNNRFTATLQIRPHRHPLDTLPEFYFGREDGYRDYREDFIDETLDETGQFQIKTQPVEKPADLTAPLEVKTVVSLFETGGRPVTRAIQRTLWPASALIGLRPLFKVEEGDTAGAGIPQAGNVQFEVIKINREGQLLAASELAVQLIREDRDYYWHFNNGAWQMDYREAEYPEQRLNLNLTTAQRTLLTVPVNNYGRYRLEVLDPATKLTTMLRFNTWGWYGDEDTQGAARPDKVMLHLDKPAYRAGETIQLKVLPPHAGEGLIMVETREKPLWSSQQSIPAEGAIIQIPVAKEWQQHDLYISALVLRQGQSKFAAPVMTPNRALGLIHLPLDRSDRQLQIQLQTSTKIQPETLLPVKVKVDNLPAHSLAMVTIAAVDVGILNLTNFVTPDPYHHFFAPRSYQVDMYDLYGQVIENLAGVRAKLRFGGDAALAGGKRPDAKIKIVSLFTGPVTLNDQGEAEITLAIPDFNGRLRIMAVAFSEDRFAAAETEVTVVAPIVTEISTPRFLATGDKSLLSLDVHNLSGKTQSFQLTVSATPPLVLDELAIPITLNDQQKNTLRVPLRGGDEFGVGQINLALQGPEITLQRHWELGVRPPYAGERIVLRETLTPGQLVSIDQHLADHLMPKTVMVDALISTKPPLNVRSAFQFLLQYPYGCLEQTTSSAYPLLYVTEAIAKRLEISPLSNQERQKRLEVAFTRLATMQKANGGFGLWSSQDSEENWLTPYVLNFLLDAKAQGFAIPESMLERGVKRLLEQLQATLENNFAINYQDRRQDKSAMLAAKAFAAYVLARLNRAPLGTLRTLYEQQLTLANSPLPMIHLGLALYLQGDQPRGLKALEQALKQPYETTSGYHGDYGSALRDLTLLLYLLHKHQIQAFAKGELWKGLNQLLPEYHWFSTQERNALFLLGLAMLSNSATEERLLQLQLGSQSQTVRFQDHWQRRFTLAELQTGIQWQAPDNLYLELEVTGYPAQLPVEDQSQVKLERSFYTLDGNPIEDRPLEVGELLLAFISLRSENNNIDNGLLVDFLPAGLEIENPNLLHSQNLEEFEVAGVKLQEAMKQEAKNLKHQEYRDDRFLTALRLPKNHTVRLFYLVRVVTPGTYLLPPPSFEDMYRPAIRAVGAGGGLLRIEGHR